MHVYVGIDWAEEHHDICVLEPSGTRLGSRRIADGVQGVEELHALAVQCHGPSRLAILTAPRHHSAIAC